MVCSCGGSAHPTSYICIGYMNFLVFRYITYDLVLLSAVAYVQLDMDDMAGQLPVTYL